MNYRGPRKDDEIAVLLERVRSRKLSIFKDGDGERADQVREVVAWLEKIVVLMLEGVEICRAKVLSDHEKLNKLSNADSGPVGELLVGMRKNTEQFGLDLRRAEKWRDAKVALESFIEKDKMSDEDGRLMQSLLVQHVFEGGFYAWSLSDLDYEEKYTWAMGKLYEPAAGVTTDKEPAAAVSAAVCPESKSELTKSLKDKHCRIVVRP